MSGSQGAGAGIRRRRAWVLALILSAVLASNAVAAPLQAGPQGDGTSITPQGWRVTPAGQQTELGPGPLDIAMSPRGDLLLVANAGYEHHSLMVIDPATGQVRQTIEEQGAKSQGFWHFSYGHSDGYYVGIAFSPDGSRAWASSGSGGTLHSFRISDGTLVERQRIKLTTKLGGESPYPAGIAVAPDGSSLFVAGNLSDSLYIVDPDARAVRSTIPVGHLPYGVALADPGTGLRAFVTNWGESSVSVVDVAASQVVSTVAVGTHPSAIIASPSRSELYVANADSDDVTVLSPSGAVLRTIDLHPYPGAPVGASPNALALSPDGRTLYVANAGNNDLAVVRLAPAGAGGGDIVEGLIPTAWYPDGVAVDPADGTLFVTNMKGLGVGPAPEGTYWPATMRGTLSRIPAPSAAELAAHTAQVRANNLFDAAQADAAGLPDEITHVIYVMKENRTYDQVLGDLERGNGDPSLAIFGEATTPNHHALARQFVTFDNFYADAEVSADGWSWTTGAYANTYNNKNWPLDYNGYGRPYDFGGFGDDEEAALPGEDPGEGFLWDAVAEAGIDYVNFGFFVDNPVDLVDSIPGLLDHTDPIYPGWDLLTPDQVRIARWLDVFDGYVRAGDMPTVQFVYLPSDHTYGTTPEARRPASYLADNDLALGRLVEAVSHSPFWASTAIFVVEDDAQDGPDHVDGHRSLAYVISPYTQTGAVDSTFYSSVSVLRTMELILGVPPLSQFDAAATPLSAAFTAAPNLATYDALVPETSLWAKNAADAPMSAESLTIDFSKPDRIPMDLMNEIIWRSVRGADDPMPAMK